jgi:hypothetical protein
MPWRKGSDKKGKVVVKCKYDDVSEQFNNGLAVAYKDGKFYILTITSK